MIKWACFRLISIALVPMLLLQAQLHLSPDEVIKRAAANEDRLKAAERNYSYRQEVLFQTIGEAGSITGQLHRISEVTYDDLGNRIDRIIEYPPSRLTRLIGTSKIDFKSLLGLDPFFLTTENLSRYLIKFVGQEKVDELNTYVFDIEPRSVESERAKHKSHGLVEDYDWPFKGRIWIDDQDLQMVKAEGRAQVSKDSKERFPKFEYYRDYIDGKFWLPSYVHSDDILDLKRFDLPVKIKIKYTSYKLVKPRG
jgi:hypothetical protein